MNKMYSMNLHIEQTLLDAIDTVIVPHLIRT